MCADGIPAPAIADVGLGLAANPGFQALARSLWGRSELRGAALMAGAGLSRNAGLAAADSPRPPLWGDLLRAMRDELGGAADAALGALDVAARYEGMFRRGGLEGLIRRMVPDASWVPGDLHMRLLRLPWSEVLTTNYDTLLERAGDRITERAYEAVLTPEDLARTRSPRIVKLHGTLPSHTPFVITREDYRQYPTRAAPFVNLARQVLIENDVCLIGFSGDDPNFAAWTEWVQAEIAPYGRTLFLVGILELDGAAFDAYLARGIMAIDLAPFVPDRTGNRDERSSAALELFVAALESSRTPPPEAWPTETAWPPTWGEAVDPADPAGARPGLHDPAFAAAYVERCAGRWREERLAYPGWIEPPPVVRDRLEPRVRSQMLALEMGLGRARLDDPVGTVADVLWRLDLVHGSLHAFDLAWVQPVLRAVDPMRLPAGDRVLFGRLLLRTHREAEDEASFALWRDWLAPAAEVDGEVRSLLAYEEALWSRDRLDLEALAARVEAVGGGDPAWLLRRAMLLAELGRHDAVEAAVLEAFRRLQALTARDRRSIWVRSRLGWAGFLAHALTRTSAPHERIADFVAERVAEDDWLRRFDEGACNPWRCVEALDDAISDAEAQRREDSADPVSAFDPGEVARSGITMRAMPSATVDQYAARLADQVGLPMAMKERVNVLQSRVARAIGLCAGDGHVDLARVLVAASRGDKDLVQARFNRIAVARMDQAVAEELFARLRRALDYALALRPLSGYWVGRARTIVELLSRLVVRLPSDEARGCFRFALDLARHPNWRNPSLFGPLDNLLGRSLDAIAPTERPEIALDLISFPLPSEAGADTGMSWPEPGNHIPAGTVRPANDGRWSERIAGLIAAAGNGDQVEATRASFRLLHLLRKDLLSEGERALFGRAFWERRARLGGPRLLGDVALYVAYEAPAPDEGERASIIRRILLAVSTEPGFASAGGLWILSRIAEAGAADVRGYLSDQELLRVFEALVRWRPPAPAPADGVTALFDAGSLHEHMGHRIAEALAAAVLPAITAAEMDATRLAALRDLALDPPTADYVVLVPQAVRMGALDVDEAAARIQDGLLSRDRRSVVGALAAVGEWSARHGLGEVPPPPGFLAGEVAGLVALRIPRALPQALQTAGKLVADGLVTASDARRLTIGLGHLLSETAYETWAGGDEETSRVTLVRADAVRLAAAMGRHGHRGGAIERWIGAAASDPLPEVRFATA